MTYAVGYAHPGTVDAGFCDSLVALARETPPAQVIAVNSGPRIAHARNAIVKAFLSGDADWLLMVDADMVWRHEVVGKLMESAHPSSRPIVGALCFGGGRTGTIFPTIYRLGEGPEPFAPVEDWPENALCQVDATGAAFLLMHRRALERIGQRFGDPYPWFVEGAVYRGRPFSEDWAFCLRAKDLGIPVHVHTGCEVGHVKQTVLDATAYRRYRALRDELGGAQAVVEDFTRHSAGATRA